jgi:hypothetical protein
MHTDLRDYIGDYTSSEYFTFLAAHLKSHADSLLHHMLGEAQKDGGDFTASALEKLLLEHIAPLDLNDDVRRDAPQLLEAFFEYLHAAGKYPQASQWVAIMPAVAMSYAERFRDDGTIKGDTVRHSLAKVGRNDPCPCGSGKKFKKCCIDLLS